MANRPPVSRPLADLPFPAGGSNFGLWSEVRGETGAPQQAPGDDNVGRMQFLLALRKRGIGDAAVLRAMDQVPREHFVESNFVESAYSDQALPIPCGQTISQPYVVAYMTEQLRV